MKTGRDAPRVLMLIPGDEQASGSSMIFARRQAEELAATGIEVHTFFLRSRTSALRVCRELLRFRRLIAQVRPQLIHAQFGTVSGAFAALGAGRLPLVVTFRGGDLNAVPSARGIRPVVGRLLSQCAALRADRIVCVSRGLRDRLWWRRDRVAILASGVDPTVFCPQPRGEARAELGWDLEGRVVLFHAGPDPRNKRLDLALAAIEEARRRCAPLRLEVLDGNMPASRLPQLMNACDCLLVTSDAEGSPTIVQEALAVNLPIVSVEVGDVAERLRGVRNTRIAARDPQALARALVELVRTPLRTNGRESIDEVSSERVAGKLCEVYREAAERSGRARGPLPSVTARVGRS